MLRPYAFRGEQHPAAHPLLWRAACPPVVASIAHQRKQLIDGKRLVLNNW
jgi:hypothetical protein